SGPHAANAKYAEVIVSQSQPLFFMKALGLSALTVKARSVSGPGGSVGGCLYALSSTANKAFETSGSGAVINLANCDIYDNSTTTSAMFVSSGTTVTAHAIYVVGGV